jgi:hypothetical protein
MTKSVQYRRKPGEPFSKKLYLIHQQKGGDGYSTVQFQREIKARLKTEGLAACNPVVINSFGE